MKSQMQDPVKKQVSSIVVNDTTFVNLKDYSDDFVYDMKYATEDNFFKSIRLCGVLFASENSCRFSGNNKEFIKRI
jgi:D-alanyl-D-alanine dipeptidase